MSGKLCGYIKALKQIQLQPFRIDNIMKSKRLHSGFTILEVMLTVSIVLILATAASFGLRNFLLEKSFEKEVAGFWKELTSLRAKVLKNDICYFATFNTGNNTYTIQKDMDNDCANDGTATDFAVPSLFIARITYALPTPFPATTGPDGTSKPTAAVEGNWLSSHADKGLIIQKDSYGSMNDGRIMLSSSQRPKIGYCIQKKAGSQLIKLFKWTGTTWIEM